MRNAALICPRCRRCHSRTRGDEHLQARDVDGNRRCRTRCQIVKYSNQCFHLRCERGCLLLAVWPECVRLRHCRGALLLLAQAQAAACVAAAGAPYVQAERSERSQTSAVQQPLQPGRAVTLYNELVEAKHALYDRGGVGDARVRQ